MNTNSTAPWNALPVLIAGAFMVVLDFFIVNVALPSIATDLGASESSQLAGAASGALATITQVGYALGVAVTGLIFFADPDRIGHAFQLSLLQLAAVGIALTRAATLLPRPRPVAAGSGAAASA